MKQFVLFAITIFLCTAAQAQSDGVMSEEMIQKFYTDNYDIQQKDPGNFIQFMMDHTTDNAQFSMTSTPHIMGKVPKEESAILTRDQMIDVLKQNLPVMTIDKIDYKITSITLAADKKSATVSDVTKLNARMKAAAAQVNSNSACNDTLVLSPEGVIQIASSICREESYISQMGQAR
jgi:hypothetical protein